MAKELRVSVRSVQRWRRAWREAGQDAPRPQPRRRHLAYTPPETLDLLDTLLEGVSEPRLKLISTDETRALSARRLCRPLARWPRGGRIYGTTANGAVTLDARTGKDMPTRPEAAPILVNEFGGLVLREGDLLRYPAGG
ncbi:helix-turn-helix domain containing protein [Streptomyces sp. NBC_00868]|uniref:helix-turn-helix domain-containing protein n=1 Tax=Streptomyces sp. NBC_00868 TaxID=2903683 RepID=UPI003865B3AA|nr:helix-turn-helix domain containing protein [Streptomyces sp. NBC_00868]